MAQSHEIQSDEVTEKIENGHQSHFNMDLLPPPRYYVLHLTIMDNREEPESPEETTEQKKDEKKRTAKKPYALFEDWYRNSEKKKGVDYQKMISNILSGLEKVVDSNPTSKPKRKSNPKPNRRWKKVKGQQGLYFTPEPIAKAQAVQDRQRLKDVIDRFIREGSHPFSSHAWLSEVIKYQ